MLTAYSQNSLLQQLYENRYTNSSDSTVRFYEQGNYASAIYYSREFEEEYQYRFRMYCFAGDTLALQVAAEEPCESESCGTYCDIWEFEEGKWKHGDWKSDKFAPFINGELERLTVQRGYLESVSDEYTFYNHFNLAFQDSNTIVVEYIAKRLMAAEGKEYVTEITYKTFLRLKDGHWIIDPPKQVQIDQPTWDSFKADYDQTGSVVDNDGYTNVRNSKSSSSDIVDVVYFNKLFYYKYPVNGWCEVILRTGSKGYINESLVSKQ